MADLDAYKKQQKELIEARKLKNHLADAEKIPAAEAVLPVTPREKLANVWYHYKALILAAAFALIVGIILLVQLCSRPKYDVSFTLVSGAPLDGSVTGELITEKLKPHAVDRTGDGVVEIDYMAFRLAVSEDTEMTPQMLEYTRAKLFGRASDGEVFLYLLDENSYDQLVEVGMQFLDLSDRFSGEAVDGDKYHVENSILAAETGLGEYLDGMFLCISDYYSYDEKVQQKEKVRNAFEADYHLLEALIGQ